MADAAVTLTERAARRVAQVLSREPEGTVLRVSIEGGGCSGFQYRYDLTREPAAEDDIVLGANGATVLIDPVSAGFLEGAEIDFVDDLMGQAFQIRNPNAIASCGCGTSFSV